MEPQSPFAGCTAAESGSVTEKPKLISVCVDFGAEITVWPLELAPETPTEESVESGSDVKYFGPGDMNGPKFVNHGRRRLELTHRVRVFAVEYSAQRINRAQRSVKDNRTAYELRKGRPYKRKLPPFAEAVMHLRVAVKRTKQKFEDKRNTGIYLGLVE